MRLYARLQIDMIPRTRDLFALGCLDRRLPVLASQIGALAGDTAALLPGHPRGFTGDEIARLRDAAPRLEALCAALEAFRIPSTLEHADFHDWSDGCVAHPFFSLVSVMEHEEEFPRAPDAAARIRDAYLEPWAAREPMPRLREAFEIAQTLAAVHLAWSYHRIITNIEESARWEMGATVPFYLRMALERLDRKG